MANVRDTIHVKPYVPNVYTVREFVNVKKAELEEFANHWDQRAKQCKCSMLQWQLEYAEFCGRHIVFAGP